MDGGLKMKKIFKKVKIIVFFVLLLSVAGFLNNNGIIYLGFESNTVYAAATLTSDDGLWKFTEKGEIKSYLGNDTEITIPAQLTSNNVTYCITKIPWDGLSWNNAITKIDISSNITFIDNSPFAGMTSLKSIQVSSDNINYCDINGVLYDKAKTKLMRFPQMNPTGVLELPDTFIECNIDALESCKNVHILKIPVSYTGKTSAMGDSLKVDSFPNLAAIEVLYGNTTFSSEEGVLYNYDKTALYWYPCKKSSTDFTIPYSVESIAFNAFKNAVNLQNINLTSNIKTLNYCLSGCKLKSINNITTREEYINWDPSTKAVFQKNLDVFGVQPFLISLVEQEVQYAVDNYIKDDMNDYQKIKALYNYAANKVEYVSDDTSDLKNHCISSIFLNDTTVCEGYALGMSLLLDKIGITNCPVDGPNHVWLVVKINGVWLQLDPTWDDEGDYAGTEYFLKTTAEYTKLRHPTYNGVNNATMTTGSFNDYSFGKDKSTYFENLPKCDAIIGDINSDGVLDQSDIDSMENEIQAYAQHGYYNVLADMNRDGQINTEDYNLLNSIVLKS